MSPDQWRQVEELYRAVDDCDPRERAALLSKADPDVRHVVESLLAVRGDEGPLGGVLLGDPVLVRGETGDRLRSLAVVL